LNSSILLLQFENNCGARKNWQTKRKTIKKLL